MGRNTVQFTLPDPKSAILDPKSLPCARSPPRFADSVADTTAGDGAGGGECAAGGGVSQTAGAVAGAGGTVRDRDPPGAGGEYALRPRAGGRDPGARAVARRLDLLSVEY